MLEVRCEKSLIQIGRRGKVSNESVGERARE